MEVANSPFAVNVEPSLAIPSNSIHNLADIEQFSSREEISITLTGSLFDAYGNAVTATDSIFVLNIPELELTIELLPPKYETTVHMKKDEKITLTISFTLDGEHIQSSPKTVKVTPLAVSAGYMASVKIVEYGIYLSTSLYIMLLSVLLIGFGVVAKKDYITRANILAKGSLVYSIVDWTLDLLNCKSYYNANSDFYGKLAMYNLIFNAVFNAFAFAYAVKSETYKHQALDVKLKKRRLAVNLSFTAADSITTRGQLYFRSNGLAVAIIFLLVLSNLQALTFLPWLKVKYNGLPSRFVFLIGAVLPLMTENIPQLAIAVFFVANQGGFTKVYWTVPLSMTFSACSIAFTLANKGLIVFQGDRSSKVGVEEEEFAEDEELMNEEEKRRKKDTRLAQATDETKEAQAEIATYKKTIEEFKEQSQQADRDLQRAIDKSLEEAEAKEKFWNEQLVMSQNQVAKLNDVVNEMKKKYSVYDPEGEEEGGV